jgi:serine/threonine-protein kinase RsbW
VTIETRAAPSSFREIATWDLSDFEDLAVVRADLRELLKDDVRDGAVTDLDRLLIVASELATNALRHGRRPARLRLLGDGTGYLVDAVDHAADVQPSLVLGRDPGQGGLGLVLVKRLAQDVGSYVSGRDKHVWARFDPREPQAS